MPDTDYTDRHGKTWHTLTADDLAEGTPVRALVESVLDSWAPNYVTDGGRVSSYSEWVERVEGTCLPDGTYADLGTSTEAGSTYAAIRKIALKIARDLR